ncbi:hypothetical protein IWW45_002708 [Coemansia sp. RSA 485]|nr:hypothetical protein IWW45_002708 [Coemansia sp. RSA 485]
MKHTAPSKAKVANGKVQKKPPPPAKPTKQTTEIDDIFASKPKQPQPPTTASATAAPVTKPSSSVKIVDATLADKIANPQKQKLPPKTDDNFGDSRGQKSKYTDDGMRVFYYDDLHIGEGEGDTDQCPFDCNCCF